MSYRLLAMLLALSLAGCAGRPGPAESVTPLNHLPALRGDYFRIESTATGRAYHIYVRLPADYAEQPARTYPIVYLLDGDSLFPILAANHLFIHYDDNIPDAIVVGIAYGSFAPAVNKRDVDFTPPAPGLEPGRAGAPAFQRFLKDELLPRVERAYRADPARRILFGQSRGGSFVLYSAFTDPALFWGHIASNPAFRPGRDLFFGPAPAAPPGERFLIVASGTRDRPQLREDAVAWSAHWLGKADAPWRFQFVGVAGGTHSADSPIAYRAGMRRLFVPDPR